MGGNPDYLAIYGSLAPGKINHGELAGIPGSWHRGWVEGTLFEEGWGAAAGYPGIRLQAGGPRVDVDVLKSNELPQHWPRLDDFEGHGYRRVAVEIHGLAEMPIRGWIYELA